MKLDDRTAVLVAIGSAPAVNCHDCLRHLRDQATAQAAVSPQEMAAAVEVGLRVSRAARDKTSTFAAEAFGTAEANRPGDRQPAAAGAPPPRQAAHRSCSTSDKKGC